MAISIALRKNLVMRFLLVHPLLLMYKERAPWSKLQQGNNGWPNRNHAFYNEGRPAKGRL